MRRRGQQIGRFDKRLKFQYQSRVSDGMGGYTNTWVDDLTVWAMFDPMSERQMLSESRLDADQQYKITIRWTNDFNSDLDNNYRAIYQAGEPDEIVFNIHSVHNPGANREFFEIIAWVV